MKCQADVEVLTKCFGWEKTKSEWEDRRLTLEDASVLKASSLPAYLGASSIRLTT